MAKKLIYVLLALTLILSLAVTASAETQSNFATSDEFIESNTTLERAEILKELGLFKGTNKGFELDRAPTRVEAIVLLLRTIGEANQATIKKILEGFPDHPFADVPSWADDYVSYAYNRNYTHGVSATKLGSSDTVTPEQFITFMLRALGYNDMLGDFNWEDSIQKAEELNIIPANKYHKDMVFLRGDCVDIIFNLLTVYLKDEDVTLVESLCRNSTVSVDTACKYNLIDLRKLVQKGWSFTWSEVVKEYYAEEVVRLINIERASIGLHELRYNPELSRIAQIKAEDMGENFSVNSTYGSASDMLRTFGIDFRIAGENRALAVLTPRNVVELWLETPGGQNNIYNPRFTDIGVGFTWQSLSWSMMFIGH